MKVFKKLCLIRTSISRALLLFISVYAAQSSVNADVLVNFNTSALSPSSNQAQIGSYMGGILGMGVTVSGATVTSTYDGDGHVIGSATKSTTLGADGGNFLITQNEGSKIVLTFAKPIYGITFDMEIFPDVNSNNASTLPDFTFKAFVDASDAGSIITFAQQTHFVGTFPTAGQQSPQSGGGTEQYAQLLQTGLNFAFPNGATKLEFIDWPPTIGIDNLNVQLTPSTFQDNAIPEPTSIVLLAGGLMGAGVVSWIRRRKDQHGE